MTNATLPKIPTRIAPLRHAAGSIAVPRAKARPVARAESLAAALTLAAVVAGTLLFAISFSLLSAVGA
jgi:hypothetical protein